jgi:hypothetical protein
METVVATETQEPSIEHLSSLLNEAGHIDAVCPMQYNFDSLNI